MKKFKNDNKGFTLVELIVVLVILAILAAILVPALLGYIDEAKNKQLELHGKSVYTAAQAVASKAYGAGKEVPMAAGNTDATKYYTNFVTEVQTISEITTFGTTSDAYIKVGTVNSQNPSATEKHNKWTIVEIVYVEDGEQVQLTSTSGAWTKPATKITDFSSYLKIPGKQATTE